MDREEDINQEHVKYMTIGQADKRKQTIRQMDGRKS